jgi:hypothetical protein
MRYCGYHQVSLVLENISWQSESQLPFPCIQLFGCYVVSSGIFLYHLERHRHTKTVNLAPRHSS